MENSRLWLLNHKDWIKACVMFVLGQVVGVLLEAIRHKTQIDWGNVEAVAIGAFLTYLSKQLGTGENGNVIGTTALVEKLGASKESNK